MPPSDYEYTLQMPRRSFWKPAVRETLNNGGKTHVRTKERKRRVRLRKYERLSIVVKEQEKKATATDQEITLIIKGDLE